MDTTGSIVHNVLSALTSITNKHSCREYTVLNDIATALYGLLKPVEEVRYIVSRDNLESIIHTILEAHGVGGHYSEVLERIKDQRLVAVSTVFYPLLVLEIALNPLEDNILANSQLVDINEYKLCIPKLEYLIAKLISMKLYPYNIYGYTLFFTWLNTEKLDFKLLVELLKISNVNLREVVSEIENMSNYLQLFKPQKLEKSLLEFKSLVFSVM